MRRKVHLLKLVKWEDFHKSRGEECGSLDKFLIVYKNIWRKKY